MARVLRWQNPKWREIADRDARMAVERLDTTNLHRASAILKIAGKLVSMKEGDTLEVIGSSMTFTSDVEEWCKKYNKKYSFHIDPESSAIKCRIDI